jgi:hypothetical protein
MHRTIKVIGWLSKGYTIPMAGRVIAMVSTNAGLPFLALKATSETDGVQGEPVMLGMEPDLGILYSFVKEISDEDWDTLLVNVAATEASRRHKR